MGKNTIGDLCRTMTKKAQIPGRHTNHGARRGGVQAMKDADVSENDISKLTGHKNLHSLQSYYEPSLKKQKQMSDILTYAATGKGACVEARSHNVAPPKPDVVEEPLKVPGQSEPRKPFAIDLQNCTLPGILSGNGGITVHGDINLHFQK